MLSAGLPRKVTARLPMQPFSQIRWTCCGKVKSRIESRTSQMTMFSKSIFKDPWGSTLLDKLELRKMTTQTEWRTKSPLQVVCVLEDLKCWGAWDPSCRHKPKQQHKIDHRKRAAQKKKKKRRSTIPFNWTRYSPCQIGQHWNCFKRNIGENSKKRGGEHIGFPERLDISNWIELFKARYDNYQRTLSHIWRAKPFNVVRTGIKINWYTVLCVAMELKKKKPFYVLRTRIGIK